MKTDKTANLEGQESLPANRLLEGTEAALDRQKEHVKWRKKECKKARNWLKRNSAEKASKPWIRNLIQGCDLEDYYVILSGHDFWEEHELREGLRSLYGFSYQACVDIYSREKGIAAYEIGRRGPPLDVEVTHPADLAQKDFMAYCASAVGFRDTLRRIIQIRSDDEPLLSRLAKDCFELEAGGLIVLLRNSLFHARPLSPVSSVSMQETSSGVMYILRSQLSDLRDRHLKWCKAQGRSAHKNARNQWLAALGYFEKVCVSDDWTGDAVSLSQVVADHFKQLNKCYRSVRKILKTNVSAAEQDFKTLTDSAFSQYASLESLAEEQ